jgi:predicted GIY-YIG superfamily endonuclease
MTTPERTSLYRLFDHDDQLLYVGITCNPDDRWRRHAGDKAWWPTVVRKALEWHVDRETALLAECHAITTEHPRWNIAQPNPADPLRSAGGAKSPGRPKIGQKPIVSFRPDAELLAEFDQYAAAEGRSRTDVLTALMHDWVHKKNRAKPTTPGD